MPSWKSARPTSASSPAIPEGVMTPVRSLWRYRIPCRQPLPLPAGPLAVREGLVLVEQDRFGQVRAAAEAAPLPGFSGETLDEVSAALGRALARTGQWPPASPLPSVQWALRMLRTGAGMTPADTDVPVAGFGRHRDSGIIKVKLGPDLQDNRHRIRQALATGARLRLDANRQLDVRQALTLFSALSPDRVDGVEEPCAGLEESLRVCQRTGLPLWLDETTRECPPDELLRILAGMGADARAIAAVVLKPMLLGDALDAWLDAAGQARWRVILSSTYESPVGLAVLRHLAARIAPDDVHGLDTAHLFACTLPWPPEPGLYWRRLWPQ